jgi:hypothetical protein
VRFFAPTSGIYTIALDVVITSGVDRHTFRTLNPMAVLFESRRSRPTVAFAS